MNLYLPIFRTFIVCLLYMLGLSLAAQVNDTSAIQQRTFTKASLDKYKQDSDFAYEEIGAIEAASVGDLIQNYLRNLLRQLFSEKHENNLYRILFYVLMIGSVVLIILNLMGIRVRTLFARKSERALTYTVEQENIKEMNLDDLIADSFTKKQWRLCVRFQYLKTLRLLADFELINWQLGKTNMDYYYELKTLDQKSFFITITSDFEKAWYGKVDLTETDYLQTKVAFDNFYSLIKTAKK